MSVLNRTYFHVEAAAFAHLESRLWPVAPACPHCGSVDAKHYDLGKTRLGLLKCCQKGCRKQFTVKVGTVFEQAHIPLNKCFQAVYFMCVSKRGMSAHQLHRMLEISYKAAWFLCHRIREAMRDDTAIENRAYRKPAPKKAVLSLIERDGKGFGYHGTLNHSANEYLRMGSYISVKTAESFFSLAKRGINGTYHSVSEAHLHRYLAEFDFRYNNRARLGCEDDEWAGRALVGLRAIG